MKNTPIFLLAALFAVAIVTYVAPRPQAPQGSAVALYGALDTSDSVRQEKAPGEGTLLGRSIVCVARLGARLDQNRDPVSVSRVDRQTHEFYDQLAPRSREKFQWLLIDATAQRAAQNQTFPATFWTGIARRTADSPVPFAVVYAGDADNDDLSPASTAAMRAAARQLAANPNCVAVAFYGANPKNWDALRDIFAPLGDRLLRQAPDAMDATPLMQKLEAARHR